MSHHREIKLEWAAPLHDNIPAADLPPDVQADGPDAAAEAPILPASFPADKFTADQLAVIAAWYRQMQADLYDAARTMLATDPAEGLANFMLNAALIARMLRLHPACEQSISTLARALNVDKSDLAERNRALVRTAAANRRATCSPRTLSLRELAKHFPQLDFSAREGRLPTVIVPFVNRRATLAEQWHTVTAIAAIPGLAATLALTADSLNAVRITFPSHTHNTTNMSTHNAIIDMLDEQLTPALSHARRALTKHAFNLPHSTCKTLTGYLESLHTYATTRHGKPDLTPREAAAAARHLYLIATNLQPLDPSFEPLTLLLRDLLY